MTSAAFVEAVKRWTMHDHLRPERRGVSIAAAIVAMLVVRGLFGWQQRRFADQLFRQLHDAVQLVTSTVRSGLPVHEAFRTIARKMPQRCTGSESQIAQGLTYLVNTLSTVEFERNGCRLSQWRLLHVARVVAVAVETALSFSATIF
jgi:tight adherence protein B